MARRKVFCAIQRSCAWAVLPSATKKFAHRNAKRKASRKNRQEKIEGWFGSKVSCAVHRGRNMDTAGTWLYKAKGFQIESIFDTEVWRSISACARVAKKNGKQSRPY